MATGTIKKVVADRGFGFITGQDGKDYFFHRDSLVPPLSFDRLDGGEPVTYEVEDGPKGPRANKVSGAQPTPGFGCPGWIDGTQAVSRFGDAPANPGDPAGG